MNIKLINQAVKLKMLECVNKKEYVEALARILASEEFTSVELTEYIKRTN